MKRRPRLDGIGLPALFWERRECDGDHAGAVAAAQLLFARLLTRVATARQVVNVAIDRKLLEDPPSISAPAGGNDTVPIRLSLRARGQLILLCRAKNNTPTERTVFSLASRPPVR